MVEVEIEKPNLNLPFEPRCKMNEELIKWEVDQLKIKYQRAIENLPWRIDLVIESKIDFEKEYLKAV